MPAMSCHKNNNVHINGIYTLFCCLAIAGTAQAKKDTLVKTTLPDSVYK